MNVSRAWRRGKPTGRIVGLMAGWGAVGVLFCGLYFYQEYRFPFLWIALVDLLVAWGLIRAPFWEPLRRGWRRKIALAQWGRIAAVLVALIIVRGEHWRLQEFQATAESQASSPRAERIEPMMQHVPKGAWLFSNYEPPVVATYRTTPGPTGGLYTYILDRYMNTHMYPIAGFSLDPRRPRPDMKRWIDPESLPTAWRKGPTVLIGPEPQWNLTPAERSTLFSHPVYLLIINPPTFPETARHLRETIMPLLESEVTLETIQRDGSVTLYRTKRMR